MPNISIKLAKVQGTRDQFAKLRESQRPYAIHFAGRGEKGTLVVEGEDCVAEYLNPDAIKDIKMDFVFVSDPVAAKVFLQAGASVIVESVDVVFMEKFYSLVW